MKFRTLIFTIWLVLGSASHAEILWSPKADTWDKQSSTEKHQHSSGHAMQHGRNSEKSFYLLNGNQAAVKFFAPDLSSHLLKEQSDNKFILPNTGMDNYHALIAEQKKGNTIESSLRYVYMRGKPSGVSPGKLINNPKLALEIIPDPMVREHWRYYSQNKHAFIIKYKQQPLKDSWVVMQTSNGTTLDAKTDNNGRVIFTIPDDFKHIKAGRRANQPAEFIVRTAHIDNTTYRSNFTAPYNVNPSHWQSNSGGILALSLGFISGLVIMRKHNKKQPARNHSARKPS